MANEILKRDDNNQPVIGLVTDDLSENIRMGRIDDTTKGLKVTIVGGVGAGTVTSVSVVSANGFAGTVATATTLPAITLSTTITGVLKGNGTAISAATAGTDYSAGTSALITGILKSTTVTGALTIAAAVDFPTLNQNTTGSAATLTTPRAIYGNNFDGSAALTQIIASTYGGTGNGFTKFTGATTVEKTYTLPDANATILYSGGALGTPSSGTMTNVTGTAASLTSGITQALASATTTVNVSSATAPTLGQVLTATGGTTATWQTPSSSAPTSKNGATTYDVSTASGTQTIAHGLGRTPKHVRIDGVVVVAGHPIVSMGSYDGTTNCCIHIDSISNITGNSNTAAIFVGDTTDYQYGVVTVDGTNITITWTKTGSPTGTAQILWDVS